MKYRAEVDGLRALAVVPVVFFHAGFEFFSGGFVGVDVFFVISGYLITTILIEDIENKRFNLVYFYERRARRILPALFIVILACLPFALIWMAPFQITEFSRSLVAVSLFVSNILFWKESGYFAASGEEKPLLHTWSLAVEEQYYILFPIFLFFAWRFGRDRVFWCIMLFVALSLALSEWGWRNEPDANFYLLPTRAWEILAGSAAAFIVQKQGVRPNNALSLLGLLAIVIAILVYDKNTPFPSLYAVLPVGGVVMLILFAGRETVAAKLLGTKLFVGVGLISYSAYLWHQPLFAFARIRTIEAPTTFLLWWLIALTFLLAYLSWKFVEIPFRNKNAISSKAVLKLSPVALLFPLVIGVYGIGQKGFSLKNYSEEQLKLFETAVSTPELVPCRSGGKVYLPYERACEYFHGDMKIAAFGDSHINELAYALAEKVESRNIMLKHLAFQECIPSFQNEFVGFEDCSKWTNETIREIISDERIEHVIVTYRIAYALFGPHEGKYPRLVDDRGESLRADVWKSFSKMLEALVKAEKQVIYVLQPPELPMHINYLISRMGGDTINGVSSEWWKKRMSYVYQRIDDLPPAVKIFDPASLFCQKDNCIAGKDGVAYYLDDDHLSLSGARVVAREVEKLMNF